MDPYIAAKQGMKPYCRLNLYGCRPRIEARKSGHKNRGWTPQLVGWHCVGCLVRYRCDETSMEGFTYVYEMLQGRSGQVIDVNFPYVLIQKCSEIFMISS